MYWKDELPVKGRAKKKSPVRNAFLTGDLANMAMR
jgi:hypothetical protein